VEDEKKNYRHLRHEMYTTLLFIYNGRNSKKILLDAGKKGERTATFKYQNELTSLFDLLLPRPVYHHVHNASIITNDLKGFLSILMPMMLSFLT